MSEHASEEHVNRRVKRLTRLYMAALALFFAGAATVLGLVEHAAAAGLIAGGLLAVGCAVGGLAAGGREGLGGLRSAVLWLLAASAVLLAVGAVVALAGAAATVPLVLAFAAAVGAGLCGLAGLMR